MPIPPYVTALFTLPRQKADNHSTHGCCWELAFRKTGSGYTERSAGEVLGHCVVAGPGIDLHSLQDFATLLKNGEAPSPSVVFFPMHRIERIEVDARSGDLPSLAEQFAAKTGVDALKFFQQSEPEQ